MDLILWRHAEAEDGFPDEGRALTERGVRQAALMASWLKPRLPKDYKLIVSPAKRTRQTAQALETRFSVSNAIRPGASYASILAETGWPDARGCVVLVGHQPSLGQVASLLLSGVEGEWSVKKGAIWWFSNRTRRDETQTVLRAVISPDLLEP